MAGCHILFLIFICIFSVKCVYLRVILSLLEWEEALKSLPLPVPVSGGMRKMLNFLCQPLLHCYYWHYGDESREAPRSLASLPLAEVYFCRTFLLRAKVIGTTWKKPNSTNPIQGNCLFPPTHQEPCCYRVCLL